MLGAPPQALKAALHPRLPLFRACKIRSLFHEGIDGPKAKKKVPCSPEERSHEQVSQGCPSGHAQPTELRTVLLGCPVFFVTRKALKSILGGCLSLTLHSGPQVMALELWLGLGVPPWGEG